MKASMILVVVVLLFTVSCASTVVSQNEKPETKSSLKPQLNPDSVKPEAHARQELKTVSKPVPTLVGGLNMDVLRPETETSLYIRSYGPVLGPVRSIETANDIYYFDKYRRLVRKLNKPTQGFDEYKYSGSSIWPVAVESQNCRECQSIRTPTRFDANGNQTRINKVVNGTYRSGDGSVYDEKGNIILDNSDISKAEYINKYNSDGKLTERLSSHESNIGSSYTSTERWDDKGRPIFIENISDSTRTWIYENYLDDGYGNWKERTCRTIGRANCRGLDSEVRKITYY